MRNSPSEGMNCSNHLLTTSFKKILAVECTNKYISLSQLPARKETDSPSLKCQTKGISGKVFKILHDHAIASQFNRA